MPQREVICASANRSSSWLSGVKARVAALLGPGALSAGDYYNQMVLRGLVDAAIQLGASFDVVISSSRGKIVNDLDSCCFSEDYDVILAAGNEMQSAVVESAKRFPLQRFALIDGVVERVENIVSYSSDPRGVAFLCGRFASGLEDGEPVGCVLWSDNLVAREWIGGFVAGARSIHSGAEAYYSFAANAKEAHLKASRQFKRGARVIMCHAGSADAGIIQAARENEGRLIGFLNERRMDKRHVLFDVVRKLEPVIVDAVREGVTTEFQGGRSVRIGIEEGGFALDLENAHESITAGDRRRASSLVKAIRRGDFEDLLRGRGWPGVSSSGGTRV